MLRSLFLIFAVLISVSGCSSDSDTPKVPPFFVSSTPADGAEDVGLSSEVSVTYDEVITLAENHGITVNGQSATASAHLTKVIIEENLEKGKEYKVSVPAGAAINTSGVPSESGVEFSFTTEAAPQPVEISADLVVTNPSQEARNVYNFLKENYGTKIISGAVANVSWNTNEADWVYKHTGKYPAMNTFDYIHLNWSPANWIDYNDIEVVKNWWANNGIVSACWHWNVPPSEGVTDNNDFTATADETTFSAANALIEGTWENEILKADLEEMAGYLKLLRDENIPVVWRPLHEAAGNTYEYDNGTAWFWWGYDGAEAFRNLWIYMFDYFEQQGLNNLIWVWTTQTKDEAFYPGDEYVDIVGRDIYNIGSAENIASQFEEIQTTYPTKMITLSENGSVADISAQWNSGALWSYFMPWYDYNRTVDPESAEFNETSHGHGNIDWWEDAFSHDAVITLDEMPDLK